MLVNQHRLGHLKKPYTYLYKQKFTIAHILQLHVRKYRLTPNIFPLARVRVTICSEICKLY